MGERRDARRHFRHFCSMLPISCEAVVVALLSRFGYAAIYVHQENMTSTLCWALENFKCSSRARSEIWKKEIYTNETLTKVCWKKRIRVRNVWLLKLQLQLPLVGLRGEEILRLAISSLQFLLLSCTALSFYAINWISLHDNCLTLSGQCRVQTAIFIGTHR